MSDDLRDRIAAVIQAATDSGASKSGDYAQAVIDNLGLRVEFGDGREHSYQRVVGKWER